MGYYQVLTVAVVVTIFAIWRGNALLSMIAGAAWFGMLAYHLGYPPCNVTTGDNIDVFLIMVYAGMALAILVMGIQNARVYGWNLRGERKTKDDIIRRPTDTMDISEYRSDLRSRSRSARTRR